MTTSRGLLRDLVEVALFAVGLYLLTTTSVQTVHVVGLSMSPTLQNNDLLIASRLDYRLHAPERGDIIILKSPVDPSREYIKRVIGLPHDHLVIRDHHVVINGQTLEEPYVASWIGSAAWPPGAGGEEGREVPDGMYFVMGDNRDHSSDSRVFGMIKRDQIDGKAVIRVWPISHAAVLGLHPTLARAA